ncbi:hypothetical protein WN48_04431 [Eufriesea mexicana]|uniref:Uncharacterized protein n=1 Tax=Eufriesea mexicana TaxID=516756 RepID=A0A310SN95_9HYME|nr:PREDICTED: myb-like protein M [Eufriesea mexicana]OAD55661.1 hypothetical protein WN48_04431 [Eufriesea mexicana]
MSPASQGGVEVERYIGSCLISSTVRPGSHKPIVGRKPDPVIRGKTRGCYGTQNFPNGTEQCQVQYGPGGWTGAPLISMTSSPRRCNQRSSPSLGQQQQQQQSPPSLSQQQQQQACDQQVSVHLHKNPLSRLAIHTQGAPLILANRFHNRGKIHNTGNVNGIANAVCNNTGAINSYVHNNANAVTSNCTMNNNTVRCPPSRPQRPIEMAKKQQQQQQQQPSKPTDCTANKETTGTGNNSIANIDSLSIASDESSGSNNSENSLPRIIKPRKRRKKDRKPPNNAVTSATEATKLEEQQQQSNLSSNAIIEQSNSLKPYVVPGCYEQRCYEAAPPQLRNHRRPPMARESALYGCRAQTTGMSVQEIADARQRYRHVEVKVLDDNRNVVPAQMRTIPPKGYRHNGHHHHHHHHHGSNNVPRYLHEYNEPATSATTTTTTSSTTTAGCEDGVNDELGPCQCRYCDPSALIWDVDQNCYSPFLTPSPSNEFCPSHFAQMPPLFLSRPSLDCQEQSIERLFNGDNPRSHREKDGTGVVLRRSWSDPTSYFSEEISAPSKDVGVIGDRGQAESGKRRTLWRGDSIGIPVNNVGSSAVDANGTVQSPKGLEVSTEIITSPNGHRDLEIKFYSPLPNAPLPEEEKVAGVFAEEVDEDEEDFSDIWSYHESKLQQDFRTLLQAEE